MWVWHPSASSSSPAPGRLKKAGCVLDKNFRFLFRKRRRWFKPAAFTVTGSSSWAHHPAKGIKFGRKPKPSYGRKVCFVRLHLGDTSQFDELEPFVSSTLLVCYPQFLSKVYSLEETFNRKLFSDRPALGGFLEFAGFELSGALSCYQRAIFLEFFRLDKASSCSRGQGVLSGALGGFRSLLADMHLTPCPGEGLDPISEE